MCRRRFFADFDAVRPRAHGREADLRGCAQLEKIEKLQAVFEENESEYQKYDA